MKTKLKDFVSNDSVNELNANDVERLGKIVYGSKAQKKEVKQEIKDEILDKIGAEIEKALKKGLSVKDIKKYVKKLDKKLNESTDTDDTRKYAIATLTFKEEHEDLDLDTACVKAEEMFETGEFDGVVVVCQDNDEIDPVEYIVF